jgi:glutamine synthetase
MCYTLEEVNHIIEENDIKFIRLQFTDILGNLKNVAITKKQLKKAFNNKIMFDGSSIEGFVRVEESDMFLRPDLDTFVSFPWRPSSRGVARFICDVYDPEGFPFEGDPRSQLKKVLEEAEEMGYTFQVGSECEFFLFHTDEVGNITNVTHDKSGYFDLEPIDLGGNVRREICLALDEMGYEIETSHHEVACGQHEIDFHYNKALKAADDIMTFKLAVKSIAKANGLGATFMPKPNQNENGSGMHINMSLLYDGKNAFYDANDPSGRGLSEGAYYFIGGIIAHIKGMTAINNPSINSYKRFVAGYEAPIHIGWSCKNRSPLIRVPASRGSRTRIELRSPDSSANPYLVLACCLKAGLDGIKNKIIPPDEVLDNMFKMSSKELKAAGIEKLPSNLKKALKELDKDKLMQEAIGPHIYASYKKIKKAELEEYNRYITNWELDKYLNQ